jgi:hypothetical protein
MEQSTPAEALETLRMLDRKAPGSPIKPAWVAKELGVTEREALRLLDRPIVDGLVEKVPSQVVGGANDILLRVVPRHGRGGR